MGFWSNLGNAIVIYWRAIMLILFPIILLPVFVIENGPHLRCLYVILLLVVYWVFDLLPLAITSLLPVVLFPLMGVMDSQTTALCYLKEVNMLFITGLALALNLEYVNLHIRIALNMIHLIGCSPRKLLSGLMGVTIFLSMWISNTAATSMMIPIAEAILVELEENGFGRIYKEQAVDDDLHEQKPEKRTICYMIAIAYAANIGGIGTLMGTATNLVTTGIIEENFPRGPGISFIKWSLLTIPIMILIGGLTILFFQIWYLGLLRPNSKDALEVAEVKKGEQVALGVIKRKINELGPMTYNEIALVIVVLATLLLWFFRKPEFMPGWAGLLTKLDVKDSAVGTFAMFILCVILIRPREKDGNLREDVWSFCERKLSWGVVLLLGCGFAVAKATDLSGLSKFFANQLRHLGSLPNVVTMILFTLMCVLITQFVNNVSAAFFFLPALASLSKDQKVHPYYYMIPAGIAASFSFALPVSTPPNAIALEPFNISPLEMLKVSVFVTIICLLGLWLIFPFLGPAVFDMEGYPDWEDEALKD